MSLLTVFIPTYNRVSSLSITLNSLLPQSDALSVPVLVVDNASSDATRSLLEELQANHSCLAFMSRRFNIGGEGNIVSAVSQITSDYVWILGDDDLASPNALSTILDDLNRHYPDWINYSSAREKASYCDLQLYKSQIEFLKTFRSWDQLLFLSNNIFRLDVLGAGLLQGCFFQISQSPHIVAMIIGMDSLCKQRLLRNSKAILSQTSLSTINLNEGNSYNLIPYLSSSGFIFSLFSGATRKEVVRLNRNTLYNWLTLAHIFKIFTIQLYVKSIHGISWLHLIANSFITYRFHGILVLTTAIFAKAIGSHAYRLFKRAR